MSERYSRQELFSPIGREGQRRIAASHVLIVGAGALGTGAAESLVRAGVGKLTIVDRDYVEFSNLQRQQLYSEDDARARLPKAVAARNRLARINSEVSIHAEVMDVTAADLSAFPADPDLIIDATDNFDTRMLINDYAQKNGIPWIYGACVGSYGLTFTVIPGVTPCLNCLLGQVPVGGETCDTVGIIGPAVQMVVAYQTAEALKLLVGDWKSLRGKLTSFDLWSNQQAAIDVAGLRKEDCPSCGNRRTFPYLSAANHAQTAVLCGRDTVQIRPPAPVKRDLQQLGRTLAANGHRVEQNAFLLTFHADGHRLVIFADGRVLVHGTKDISQAKKLYYRYLG